MKIEHEVVTEVLSETTSRVSVHVKADGLDCGKVIVFSGPKYEAEDLVSGAVTLKDLQDKMNDRSRRTVPRWRP